MKFGDKLFLTMTAVMTVVFMFFGTWMLASYFGQLLNREIAQIETEGQMYQYLYEMAYHGLEDFGKEYAARKAFDSVVDSIEEEDILFFAMSDDEKLLYGSEIFRTEGFLENFQSLRQEMKQENTYVCGIREIQNEKNLLYISVSTIAGEIQYLGICRNLTEIYEERNSLQNRYYLALGALVLLGGICVYVMSKLFARPIQGLSRVAQRISDGDFELRSNYRAGDEVGILARNFNHMADKMVAQMQEKELEAKRQEDFTAAFAHELKTPLTSIIGYADMLNTMELTEAERREAYYYIYSQGKRLESLSHKLLELVGLNRSEIKKQPIQTKILEEDIRATMRPIFQQKKIKGKVDLEKAVLYGDKELLLSLFYNLLDNASKAVEKGGFVLMKGRKAGDAYEIKVIDNGRGIAKQEIERITEAFYMVDKSRSRKEGGAGIGLSLCRQIIELHEGLMKIVSNPGEGTVIRLLLPLVVGDVQTSKTEFKEVEGFYEKE